MQSRPEAADVALLSASGIQAGYRGVQVIWDVTLTIGRGEVVALVGSNGAGKTTLLRTLSGVLPLWNGSVSFEGQHLTGRPSHVFVAAGIAHVPEGRRLFAGLSVEANLRLGAFIRKSGPDVEHDLERIYSFSPNSRTGGISLLERSAADSSKWWPSAAA